MSDQRRTKLRPVVNESGIEIKQGGRFVLGNTDYDRSLSTNPSVRAVEGDAGTITFEVDTGAIAR